MTLETHTMRPLPRSAMCRSTACDRQNAPDRLTFSTLNQTRVSRATSLLTVRPRPAKVRAMLERLGLIGRDKGRRRRRGGRTDSTGDARVLSLLATLQSDEIPSEGLVLSAPGGDRQGLGAALAALAPA